MSGKGSYVESCMEGVCNQGSCEPSYVHNQGNHEPPLGSYARMVPKMYILFEIKKYIYIGIFGKNEMFIPKIFIKREILRNW